MKVNQVCIQVKRIAQAPCAWWKHCIDITQGREIAKKPVWSEFWTRSLTKIMRKHISTLYYQIKVNENGLDIILINIPEPVLILLLKNIYFFYIFTLGGIDTSARQTKKRISKMNTNLCVAPASKSNTTIISRWPLQNHHRKITRRMQTLWPLF